ncbi:hypothetical protein M405DRAFT_752267 [Rhizopogon salebrosus TDB-379]|nr:hypothetical protein M405DRAFT_752267 [Rhizopogon salebrosus TDB-379]
MNPPTTPARQRIREAWSLERLTFERSVALGFALESTTMTAYDSHLNSYLNFCRLHNRPIDPTPDTLSFFVVWLSHHIEPRSVDSYLSGIVSKLEAYYPGARDAQHSRLVARTLRGCKRRLSQPVTRKAPLSRSDIEGALASPVITSSYNDTLFAAMLFTGFETLQRLGELTWPDSRRHQSYRHVAMHHTLVVTHDTGWSLCLSARTVGGATALAASGVAPDLIRAAGRWSSDEFNKYIRVHPYILHAMIHDSQV